MQREGCSSNLHFADSMCRQYTDSRFVYSSDNQTKIADETSSSRTQHIYKTEHCTVLLLPTYQQYSIALMHVTDVDMSMDSSQDL